MSENTGRPINWDNVTCLIVDDDKFSRTFIKTALHQIGIKHAKEAGNSQEAVEALREFKVDVILLDQQMPDKNGLDFARDLMSGALGVKRVPIIMITIDTKEKTVLDAKSLGIQEYLIKPISPVALKKRIASAIERE